MKVRPHNRAGRGVANSPKCSGGAAAPPLPPPLGPPSEERSAAVASECLRSKEPVSGEEEPGSPLADGAPEGLSTPGQATAAARSAALDDDRLSAGGGLPSVSGHGGQGSLAQPAAAAAAAALPQQRTLRQLIGPVDVHTAIAVASLAQGTMCFLMLPVPVAMMSGGFSFAESALVMQLHLVAMYLPSFLSGQLMSRLGAEAVKALGAVVLAAGSVVQIGGVEMAHFSAGEILVVRARAASLTRAAPTGGGGLDSPPVAVLGCRMRPRCSAVCAA